MSQKPHDIYFISISLWECILIGNNQPLNPLLYHSICRTVLHTIVCSIKSLQCLFSNLTLSIPLSYRFHVGKPSGSVTSGNIISSSSSTSSHITSTQSSHDLKILEKTLCLPTIHVITGIPLSSNLFLTFLVHRLVIPQWCSPLKTMIMKYDGKNGDVRDINEKMKELMNSIAGRGVDDAATYLLAALASRPGDGRRRTLEELISALRIECKLDTTNRLESAIKTAKIIQQLITPPGDWAAREMFHVPSRDLLQAFAQLNTHKLLDGAICSISMDQPLALEATVKICEPLETIIRKGIPLVKYPKSSVEKCHTAAASSKSASGIKGMEEKDSLLSSQAKSSIDADSTKDMLGELDLPLSSLETTTNATGCTLVDSSGSPLRERGDTMDSQSSNESVSASRGVGVSVELEHFTEDPSQMMIGSDQHLTNGNSSDEHDSDEDGDGDEDDDEDDEDDDDDCDEDDEEEMDDEDDDDDDEDDEHGDDRDGIRFDGGVTSGGGRASFDFNVDGMAVTARLSPTGNMDDDDDDDDHHHDDDGDDDDDDEGADRNFIDLADFDEDEDENDMDEDEDEEGDDQLDMTGGDDEFVDLEEDDDDEEVDGDIISAGGGVGDIEDPEGMSALFTEEWILILLDE